MHIVFGFYPFVEVKETIAPRSPAYVPDCVDETVNYESSGIHKILNPSYSEYCSWERVSRRFH